MLDRVLDLVGQMSETHHLDQNPSLVCARQLPDRLVHLVANDLVGHVTGHVVNRAPGRCGDAGGSATVLRPPSHRVPGSP